MAAYHSKLERFLKASNDGYWEWDVASDTAWVSARWTEIVGIPANDGYLPVEAVRLAIHPDDQPGVRMMTSRMVENGAHGDSLHLEHRFIRPEGGEVWVDAR